MAERGADLDAELEGADPEGRAGRAEPASPGRRGRPRKVTADDIIDAALEIGLDQVTIRRVADALGMTVPGISYHVRTREELLALVMARAVDTLYAPGPEPAATFEETVTRFAEGLFAWFREHPILVMQVAQGRILAENVERHLERLLRAAGPREADQARALDVVSQVTAAVIGAAVLEAAQDSRRSAGDAAVDSAGNQERRPPRPDHYAAVRTVLTALL
ncbi:TetR/AcrR family transcriptional regulator [Pseudofrankia asymbiotica]|uniref:Uncharacterized protein n=1 Tax=Pseudofrankia asymbiotica TaxID=1834516 RepID=A0A1V2IAM8_9ACTN|nr:TetR family transcriptional regulator [Pseudofrankia asymbiotica]ONH29481.1 hypothetical protein BL253_16540 [Pseudofrankia asymbiotica]